MFTLPLLQFPYSYGETFARTLYERGGWQAINAALANPPASSEQILHPEKYLAGEGPLPLAGPAPGSEWSVVADTALGEWMTFLMLAYSADAAARQPVEAAGRAAAGWGGDRVQVLQDPAGNTALAAHWIWDTSTDAAEFEQALRAFRALPEGNACRAANEQVDCFYTNGMEGLWLSAPDRETMDRLTTLYPQFAR